VAGGEHGVLGTQSGPPPKTAARSPLSFFLRGGACRPGHPRKRGQRPAGDFSKLRVCFRRGPPKTRGGPKKNLRADNRGFSRGAGGPKNLRARGAQRGSTGCRRCPQHGLPGRAPRLARSSGAKKKNRDPAWPGKPPHVVTGGAGFKARFFQGAGERPDLPIPNKPTRQRAEPGVRKRAGGRGARRGPKRPGARGGGADGRRKILLHHHQKRSWALASHQMSGAADQRRGGIPTQKTRSHGHPPFPRGPRD